MKLELNEAVVIRRGGIDGFPQVNLAGVPGRICSTHASALPGMVSVWVDWSKTRYADVEGLPNVINNFPADLGPGDAPPPTPPTPPSAPPKLRLV